MSNSGDVDPGEEKTITGAGSSAPQHVSGKAETGSFTTDEAPTADTEGHGSSDSGITAVRTGDTSRG